MIDYIKILIQDVQIDESVLSSPFYGSAKLCFEGNDERRYLSVKYLKDKRIVEISGSLRRWYFGNSIVRDLSREQYKSCVDTIRDLLGFTDEIMDSAKVTILEIGANIKLAKKYEFINSTLDKYPKLKKTSISDGQTVKFVGTNYFLSFYDKPAEVFKASKKSSLDKIKKNRHVLRYEIRLKKVSGVESVKSKANTLSNIYLYWNELIDFWGNHLDNIVFIDKLSPENIHTDKNLNPTQFKERLMYEGMKAIGEHALDAMLDNFAVNNRRSTLRQNLKEIWENNRGLDFRTYEMDLKEAIAARGEELKAN